MSAEGIAFDYPRDWVVAFDRSTPGPRKADGAVVVVGNFRTFDTVSVFRTEVPPQDRGEGMSEELGYRLAVEQQQSALSTMRFKMLSSRLVDADGGKQYYDYEYVIETCRGEIIEELGGKIKCLVRGSCPLYLHPPWTTAASSLLPPRDSSLDPFKKPLQ